MISVILPLYNGVNYIEESIKCIINQTYTEWELLVVSEFGNDDGSDEIVKKFEESDFRIRLIKNDITLGLSESLNKGIELANGKYIARVDVDDPSYPERFQKQVQFLEENEDVFLCGTLQRSVTPTKASVLGVPCDKEELKASLIFGCEISHCSVMFRREEWLNSGYRYNPDSLCEDYDLWTKIMFEKKIVNIPEVLVDHRWGFDNISIAKGERLVHASDEVSIRTLKQFDIDLDMKKSYLVSGWRNEPKKYARMNPAKFLKDTYSFLCLLEQRNEEKRIIDECALRKILWKRWNWACKCAGLFFRPFNFEEVVCDRFDEPVVSIVMPVYEAVNTLRESIDSVILQSYKEWELILVCEYENWDGSTEVAKYYSKIDKRIKVIENTKKEGLANSLNIGIKSAKGKYIARLDADDLANASRLITQVNYMEDHTEIALTQLYQHYFGDGSNDFIHRPPLGHEALKCKLLFFCDICHSTVMFRKAEFDTYELYYNNEHALEDYELWSRAVKVLKFATIPEIYGEYRVGGNGISNAKKDLIVEDMCMVVARQLKENLGIGVTDDDIPLLNGWTNNLFGLDEEKKSSQLDKLKSLLLDVWNTNKSKHYYDERELLKVIAMKWRWMKYGTSWHDEPVVNSIKEVLELKKTGSKRIGLYKKLRGGMLRLVQNIHFHTFSKNTEHINEVTRAVSDAQNRIIDSSVEHWTWERYKRVEKRLNILEKQHVHIQQVLAELDYNMNKVQYIDGEKLRIVFLYQIASFWPAWESFYRACKESDIVESRLLFLDETNTEKSQMLGAEEYLIKNGLEYERFEDFNIDEYEPHVVVIQTPYDEWHRQPEHWSNRFREKGYRIVYIPYGIEISDTDDSHELHFRTNVVENTWRLFTLSDAMKKDYMRYCSNSRAVRALGLPRFDYYKNYDKKRLREAFIKNVDNRKVVVWKVHFPKNIVDKGKNITVTPSLDEYVKFAKQIKKYQNLMFIFVPHPKFFENKSYEITQKLNTIMAVLSQFENVIVDTDDDYRSALAVADYVIIDRSAVMVEVGALGVPVCYVSNKEFYEPVPRAIEPLIESYYQANDCVGILDFLNMCVKGEDNRAIIRRNAFEKCVPLFDGNAGKRVLDNIIDGVINEYLI